MKLPNVSIQIISFPLAISYTVNTSSLMYTEQAVRAKEISPLCLKKLKSQGRRSGVESHMFLTIVSNDLKAGERVHMMTKVLFCIV